MWLMPGNSFLLIWKVNSFYSSHVLFLPAFYLQLSNDHRAWVNVLQSSVKSGNKTILVFRRNFGQEEEFHWKINENILFCEHNCFPQECCIKPLIFEWLENNLGLHFSLVTSTKIERNVVNLKHVISSICLQWSHWKVLSTEWISNVRVNVPMLEPTEVVCLSKELDWNLFNCRKCRVYLTDLP